MAKRGLRSIGINKIIPAQIDFTQIVSGSAAGEGSIIALSSTGTPVLINPLMFLDAGSSGTYTAGGGLGVFSRFISADANYATSDFSKKNIILIEKQGGVSDADSGQMQKVTIETLAHGMADGSTITATNGVLSAAGAAGDITGVTAGNGLTGGGDTGAVTLTVGEGTGITVASTTVSTNDSEIVHDNLSGFVANEHIDHSGVTITAGDGLTGGGTIAATRTLTVGEGTGISVASTTVSTNDSEIVHDNLSGFVANEHIDHSGVTITAGAGLTGGGTIAATRTLNVVGGTGITANANDVATNDSEIVHDNLSGFVANEHIDHSGVSVTAGDGLTGGGTIAATRTLTVGEGTGITVASTTVSTNDSEIDHDSLSNFVANEHIDHSGVSITAGNGLTGGGTIAATRTLAVGAGTGIDVAANSISVDVSDFMTNGSDNRVVTATGADAMNAEKTFTYDGDGTLIIDKNVDGIESDPKIAFRKSRGTFDSPAVVQSGDYLGTLEFKGFDGTDYETAASIDFMVDAGGTPAQTATDMPGRISFKVSPDGSSTDAEAMTIRSTGKVGIGTANPDEELHVYGNVKIENPQAANNEPAHLELYTNDTDVGNAAFIRFTRHVGNQAPADSTNFGEISFNVSAYSAEYERALIFADADGAWVYNAGSFEDTPTRLVFAVYDNALNNQMELNHEGKLTVGGTGANNRLTVRHQGGDADNGIMVYRVDSSTTDGDILGGIGFDSSDGNVPSSVLEASAYIAALAAEDHASTDKGGDLVFGTAPIDQNDDTTSNERMRIDSNGDIGIGSTSTSARLHVFKDISAPDDLGDWDNYQVVVRGGTATGKAAGVLLSTSTVGYGGSAIVHYDRGSGGVGDLVFYTKQSTSQVPPVEVMRLTDDGRMGVGDTTPEGKVHIKQAANGSADNYAGDALVIENVGGTQKWYIGIDSDDDLVFAHNNPSQATAGGYLRGGVDIDSIDFTGQHRSVPGSGSVSDYSDKVGMIVVSTGEYYNHSGSANTVDSALPKISLSSTAKDKSVYGIVSSITDENSDNQTYNLGTFGTMFPKSEDRVIVNALGEGSIWVTNINGNFENGDYITTSIIPGYGMKQDDDLLHNYTAAKITQDCNFDLNSSYECEEFEHNGVTYKRAFVGCTYHCG